MEGAKRKLKLALARRIKRETRRERRKRSKKWKGVITRLMSGFYDTMKRVTSLQSKEWNAAVAAYGNETGWRVSGFAGRNLHRIGMSRFAVSAEETFGLADSVASSIQLYAILKRFSEMKRH
jgi:hypothetical protein